MKICLMGLLCLVGMVEAFSQHCCRMSYDKNGNRVGCVIKECVQNLRSDLVENEAIEDDVNIHDDVDFLIYPNPNNGIFTIDINDKDANKVMEAYLYDSKGILINHCQLVNEVEMDISEKSAGVYLLKLVYDDCVRSATVIKF